MSETTVAYGGDLINAIPNLYYSLQLPIAVILLIAGAVTGAFSLHRGFGHAAGKVVGGIALAALTFGGLTLAHSINQTVTDKGGPVMIETGYRPY